MFSLELFLLKKLRHTPLPRLEPEEIDPFLSLNFLLLSLDEWMAKCNDIGQEVPEADKAYAMKCLYEGRIYDDGSQWKATHEACKMCSCQR